jgi:Ca2+-binding RTX toxin-like protein
MTNFQPHSGTPGTAARTGLRVGAAATLGLLALAIAIGSADAATAAPSVKTRIKGNTLAVTGSPSADVIVLRLAASDPNTLEIDAGGDGSADFKFARSKFNKIDVQAGGGTDTVRLDNSGGVFTDTEVTRVFGEDGNDNLVGSAGPETLSGGAGDDTIDGNMGLDTIAGDAGADVITWDPGDASDKVDGGTGADQIVFHGANIGETIEVVPAAGRVHLTRNIGNVVLDIGSVERLDISTVGGADALGVGDLSSTELDLVAFDLAAFGGAGDAAADSVVVNGSPASDVITLTGIAGGVEMAVQGGATTRIVGVEPGLDRLYTDGAGGSDITEANGTADSDTLFATANGPLAALGGSTFGQVYVETADETVRLNGLGGDDTLSSTGDLASITSLVLAGGDAADTLLGGNGPDILLGGDGDDWLDGNQGSDDVNGDAGDDTIAWDPGDGSDGLNGGTGADTLAFNGSNIGEVIEVASVAGHAVVTRDIAAITLDLVGVEAARLRTFAGTDSVVVNDLSATELGLVTVDLGAVGGGDAVADVVTVFGSSADDTISLSRTDAFEAAVQGGATTRVLNMEPPLDTLRINGLTGSDTTAANGLAGPDIMSAIPSIDRVLIDGGPFGGYRIESFDETVRLNGLGGDDTLIGINGLASLASLVLDGGDGADTLTGGNGADVLIGGDGADTIDGNQGADQVSADAGDDVIAWDPGDGNDSIEGGPGADRFAFRGSNIGELMDIGAPNGRLIISRNVGTVSVDMGGVETIDVKLLGGHDIIVVNDLSATEVDDVNVDLAAAVGGGDAIDDTVIVLGTPNADTISVAAVNGAIETTVPAGATTRVTGSEAALDELYVNGGDGNDVIDVFGPVTSLIQFFANP